MRLLRKIFGSTPEIHVEYKHNYNGSNGITKSIDYDLTKASRPWDKETTELMEDNDE